MSGTCDFFEGKLLNRNGTVRRELEVINYFFFLRKKEEKQNLEDVHKPRTLGHPSLFTKALAL